MAEKLIPEITQPPDYGFPQSDVLLHVTPGTVLGLRVKTGDLVLNDHTIPARAIHTAIRQWGEDPNELARWLAGPGGYNLMSKNAPTGDGWRFYLTLDRDYEVGFITRPKGAVEVALVQQEVWHSHPYCDEVFIVTKGKVSLEVGEEVMELNPKKVDAAFLSYAVPAGTPHLLTELAEDTELILVKHPTTENYPPNWTIREVY